MLPRRWILCLVVGLCLATFEAWDVHTDDGCALETHCNACLLKLGTTGVPTLAFAMPPVVAIAPLPPPAPVPAPDDAAPRDPTSRGPPLA
jgi:hypothetical protein